MFRKLKHALIIIQKQFKLAILKLLYLVKFEYILQNAVFMFAWVLCDGDNTVYQLLSFQ